MQRLRLTPRRDWQARMESIGFLFHSIDGTYWDESACYRFTSDQIDELEKATQELHEMCRAAVDHVVRNALYERLSIPEGFGALVESSWRHGQPSVYGRMDFAYDGRQPPKLLEYNADTPTALFEASVAQWFWLRDVFAEKDQFNSIHERLIERWKAIGRLLPNGEVVYFSCLKDNLEDYSTTEYMRDVASQAGLQSENIYIEDIGLDDSEGVFVDLEGRAIDTIFKLYPWEWLIRERFGERLRAQPWRIIEPPWKMVLSNKGILPVLWELYPEHPNLLPAYAEPGRLGDRYVKKPLFSREGDGISVAGGPAVQTTLECNEFIYQHHHPLPVFEGNHTVIGSWVIGDDPAGIGIREDHTPITRNTSRFVPHYFE